MSLHGRYALLVTPVALSVRAGFKVPLGYEPTPPNDGPPLGTGEVDAELHVLAGKSSYTLPFYLSSGLGYRQRRGRFNDEILYAIEEGYRRWKK